MERLQNILARVKQSRLFADSFWALCGSVLGKGMSLLAGIVVARFLGSELYGEYGTIKNTLLMIAIFSSLGLGYSATKFIAESVAAENAKRILDTHRIALVATFAMSFVIAMLLVLGAGHVASWLDAPHLATTLRLSAIAVIFNAVNTTQTGELAGFGAYKALAKNNTYTGIFTLLASIVLAYFFGFNGAVIALILSLLFNAILNQVSLRTHIKSYNISTAMSVEPAYVREVISYSLPIALQESLYSVTHWVNLFIIIKLAGYTELGISSAASQWMAVVLFVPGALRNVALSHLSATNNNREGNRTILRRLVGVNFLATFIPFILILICSHFIESWYGSSFNGLQRVLNVCVFTAVVNSVTNVLTQEFMAHSRNWFLFFSRLLRDVGILVTMYWAISYWGNGALTAAVVTLLFQIIYLILLYIKYRRL